MQLVRFERFRLRSAVAARSTAVAPSRSVVCLTMHTLVCRYERSERLKNGEHAHITAIPETFSTLVVKDGHWSRRPRSPRRGPQAPSADAAPGLSPAARVRHRVLQRQRCPCAL